MGKMTKKRMKREKLCKGLANLHGLCVLFLHICLHQGSCLLTELERQTFDNCDKLRLVVLYILTVTYIASHKATMVNVVHRPFMARLLLCTVKFSTRVTIFR